MSELRHAGSFHELVVYQKARDLAWEIYRVTSTFPKEEMFSLTDQVRRSSRSVGAQIAKAWAKRRYERHFVSQLSGADGEQQETQHWIEIAADCGYLDATQATALKLICSEIGRMLNSMIEKAGLFCGEPSAALREPSGEYFVELRTSDQ